MLNHFSAYMATQHIYSYLKELKVGKHKVEISPYAMN